MLSTGACRFDARYLVVLFVGDYGYFLVLGRVAHIQCTDAP